MKETIILAFLAALFIGEKLCNTIGPVQRNADLAAFCAQPESVDTKSTMACNCRKSPDRFNSAPRG